ncbi:MAG TPA: LysR family transcriptional regulator [Streptosporangiaceae bacterium]|jgi:DNA-binding transcriptional LysR family regulator
MDRVETRELSYFLTLAEELHFGRAAQRLDITQPVLSRAIKRLERRLGVTLLERSSRKVTLTPAGEVLRHEGGRALDAVAAAVRRTQRTGHPDPRLVLVMKPGSDGGMLPDILAAYEAEPDAIAVDVAFGVAERAAMLRDGRADVGLLHSTHDLSGLDSEELLVERQVVVLPRGHRLATAPGVRLADLRDETMPRRATERIGPEVYETGQLLQLIALGRMVAVAPESVRGRLRDDLVAVPVVDAPPVTLLLAWPEGSRSRAVAAFVRAATTVAGRRATGPAVTALG